ncbi:MAG: hypothetical protein NWE94_06945 [Candidatus Bathyarchaeota archaeon]|nr:hypothetical protein [Candidatus Bathyarchaeota archaeon]
MNSEINITLKANDEASKIIADAGSNITASLGKVEESGKRVSETQKQTNTSAKNLVMGFSGLATSAFSLYNAYDRVADMQVSVDRANLQVKQSANSVEDAQRKLNVAIEKYGADSVQAKAAADDLRLAQERYQVAVDRAQMVQGNMNEVMVSSALSIIPTVITAIGSLSTIKASWAAVTGGVTAAQTALGSALDFLAANPIVAVVAAIGLIIGALIAAYNACPEFRDAVNAIGKALGDFFKPILDAVTAALTWLWENVLVPLGNFVVNTFIGVWEGLTATWNILCSAVDAVYNGLKWIWDNIFVPIGNFLAGYFMSVLQGLVWVWNALSTAVNTVYNGLKWLWDNVLVPVAAFVAGTLLNAWNAFASGLKCFYDNLIKPVIDALSWAYNNILKPVGDFLGGIGSALGGAWNWLTAGGGSTAQPTGAATMASVTTAKRFAEGGVVESPTLALIGEEGAEAVVPLHEFGSLGSLSSGGTVVNVSINVQGSVDERVLRLMEQRLKTVIVEATSSGAPSTQRRIRMGSVFT